jgi:hypothetical protein
MNPSGDDSVAMLLHDCAIVDVPVIHNGCREQQTLAHVLLESSTLLQLPQQPWVVTARDT